MRAVAVLVVDEGFFVEPLNDQTATARAGSETSAEA